MKATVIALKKSILFSRSLNQQWAIFLGTARWLFSLAIVIAATLTNSASAQAPDISHFDQVQAEAKWKDGIRVASQALRVCINNQVTKLVTSGETATDVAFAVISSCEAELRNAAQAVDLNLCKSDTSSCTSFKQSITAEILPDVALRAATECASRASQPPSQLATPQTEPKSITAPTYKLDATNKRLLSLSNLAPAADLCLSGHEKGKVIQRKFDNGGIMVTGFVIEDREGARQFVNVDVDMTNMDQVTKSWLLRGLQTLLVEGRQADTDVKACGAAARSLYLDAVR